MKIGHYLGCYWVKRGFRCFTGVDQCLGLHIDQFIAKCQPGCRPVPRPWHCLVCCQVSWPSPRLVSAVVSIIALATESLFSSSLRVLIINRHFRGLTVKFSLNPITTQKMANLEKNAVTHLQVIVFSYSYGAYHQSDIWEFWLGNSHSTPLRTERQPIWKMLSHASQSSFWHSLCMIF